MEANGLSKSRLSSICLGSGVLFGCTSTTTTKLDEVMIDVATTLAAMPDRMGGSAATATAVHTAMDTGSAPILATITPSGSFHGDDYDAYSDRASSSSTLLKGVSDNVALTQARIKDIEGRISHCSKQRGNHANDPQQEQQSESLALLENRLFAEMICLIDALVLMGWEHYRWFLEEESSSFETAEAAVRHIYEEALDVSIQLFCSLPPSASNIAAMNNDRLMILLLVLDFDEYCETLLEYQLTSEYLLAHPVSETAGIGGDHQSVHKRIREVLHPVRKGANYLQQLHELWKTGAFDRFDPITSVSEDEEGFAKIHAAGLCLVLFRKIESLVDRQQSTDLSNMEQQFKYLFDDYLPKQLTQRPSMNNIIATKYSRVLFRDGTPTVYWSLLVDSYRREWGDYGGDDDDDDLSTDMEMGTDDEDDGL
jgi:hypothetical protein